MDYLVKNLAFLTSRSEVRQQDTGSGAGVTQSAISKIINGNTKEPGYRTVAGIARHFRVSIDDLVNRDLENEGQTPIPSPPQPPSQPVRLDASKLALLIEYMEIGLLDSGRVLDPDRRARIIALMYADPGIQNTREAVEAAMRGAFMTME